VIIPKRFSVLEIIATGRGSRQSCRVDRFGFPRTCAKAQKRVFGFQTGDLVKALVPAGKKQGCYQGRVEPQGILISKQKVKLFRESMQNFVVLFNVQMAIRTTS
jgi:hypothetical protein